MQQSSATPKNQDVGIGLRKIVACSHSSSQCLLVSAVFGTVSSHTSYFIFNDFHTSLSCRYMLLSHTYNSGTSIYVLLC